MTIYVSAPPPLSIECTEAFTCIFHSLGKSIVTINIDNVSQYNFNANWFTLTTPTTFHCTASADVEGNVLPEYFPLIQGYFFCMLSVRLVRLNVHKGLSTINSPEQECVAVLFLHAHNNLTVTVNDNIIHKNLRK